MAIGKAIVTDDAREGIEPAELRVSAQQRKPQSLGQVIRRHS
jgi:hypothetical protein